MYHHEETHHEEAYHEVVSCQTRCSFYVILISVVVIFNKNLDYHQESRQRRSMWTAPTDGFPLLGFFTQPPPCLLTFLHPCKPSFSPFSPKLLPSSGLQVEKTKKKSEERRQWVIFLFYGGRSDTAGSLNVTFQIIHWFFFNSFSFVSSSL